MSLRYVEELPRANAHIKHGVVVRDMVKFVMSGRRYAVIRHAGASHNTVYVAARYWAKAHPEAGVRVTERGGDTYLVRDDGTAGPGDGPRATRPRMGRIPAGTRLTQPEKEMMARIAGRLDPPADAGELARAIRVGELEAQALLDADAAEGPAR